jgi:RNA polymerase sigma factor FliA
LAVTLYYMEDLRLKEIGLVLNLSESRVSRLLKAAHHRIEEHIRAKENNTAQGAAHSNSVAATT